MRKTTDPRVPALAADGLFVARSTLEMRVKNRIILHVLGSGEALAPGVGERIVRQELDAVVAEIEASAAELAETVQRARRRLSVKARHMADYGHADAGALILRRRVEEAVAALLVEGGNNDAFIEAVLSTARANALDEVVRARMLPQVNAEDRDPVFVADQLSDLRDDIAAQARSFERRRRGGSVLDGIRFRRN